MTPSKGKSPIDKKKESSFNRETHPNSISAKIHRGELTLPGKTKEETKKLFQQWKKAHKYDAAAMERWYYAQGKEH